MSIVGIALNLLLATLLTAALGMGWRLNRRLIILRESQGLADLRAATDEATDLLADRIEKARELTQKLERLTSQAASAAPAPAAPVRAREPAAELELRQPLDARRLGALLGAAREVRQRPAPAPAPAPRREPAPPTRLRAPEDDLFEEPPVRRPISAMGGGFR
jgi:hypothetical protein